MSSKVVYTKRETLWIARVKGFGLFGAGKTKELAKEDLDNKLSWKLYAKMLRKQRGVQNLGPNKFGPDS